MMKPPRSMTNGLMRRPASYNELDQAAKQKRVYLGFHSADQELLEIRKTAFKDALSAAGSSNMESVSNVDFMTVAAIPSMPTGAL